MKEYLRERGYIKPILAVGLTILVAYVGYKFMVPYYKHAVMKSETEEIARIELHDPRKVKKLMVKMVKDLRLPIREDDLYIEVSGKTITIRTSWNETVDIFGIYQKRLHFTVDVTD